MPAGVRWVPQTDFSGVEFMHADATIEDKLSYTHIYIFDWVFSKDTLRSLAQVVAFAVVVVVGAGWGLI